MYGNQKHISEALKTDLMSTPRIYYNHNVHTAPRYREAIEDLNHIHPRIEKGVFEVSNSGRVRYLEDMRRCGFVLCPRGRGIDTHRLFEALSVGAVPIMLSTEIPRWVHRLSKNPILKIEDWSQIRELNLERLVQVSQQVEPTELSTEYWVSQILEGE